MRHILVRLFSSALFALSVLSVIATEDLAAADELVAVSQLPSGVINALQVSYRQFERSGTGSAVELALPLPDGLVNSRLRPHALGVKPAPRYPRAELFSGTLLTSRSDDFLRLTLLASSPTAVPTVEGMISRQGSLYRLVTTVDSPYELQIFRIDPAELAALLATCASHVEQATGDSFLAEMARGYDSSRAGMSTLRELEVATDADYEFVSGAGGSANAKAYILATLNSVDGIYRSQLGLTIRVVFQNTWTNPNDPYSQSNPEGLLSQFFTHWEANFRSRLRYDVAHLFTGRALEFGVIGVAYTASACQFQSYSLSRVLGTGGIDVPLAAHEIGHTLGAVHDSCNSGESYIMCPVIFNGVTNFSGRSVSDIGSYVGTVSCLRVTSTPSGNRYPELAPIGPQSVNENETLIITTSATDPEGGLVALSATGMPPGASFNGTRFEYRPGYDAVSGGQYTRQFAVTFTARDTSGLSDSETVVITVQNINRYPRSSGDRTISVAEGNLISAVLDGFDPDNDPLNFYPVTTLPRGLSLDPATGRVSWRPAGDQSGTQYLRFQIVDPFGAADNVGLQINVVENPAALPLRSQAVVNDFDGDGRTDLSVFRQSNGVWYQTNLGSSQLRSFQFGLPGDVPVAGDYNGDGIFDAAVFRPSESRWFIRNSGSLAVTSFAFGLPGDLPFSGDFDADGRANIAIYRSNPGLVIYLSSGDLRSNIVSSLGGPGYIPLAGNIDQLAGDEAILFRNGQFVAKTTAGISSFGLGGNAGIPVAGDFNGDGRVEASAFELASANWNLFGGGQASFGLAGDLPIVGDFDGDGRADKAVWRPAPARWFVNFASGGVQDQQFGLPGDQLPGLEQTLYGLRNTLGRTTQASTGVRSVVDLFSSRTAELLSLGLNGTAKRSIAAPAGSIIVRGDYDGDGNLDLAVFRDGIWSISLANGSSRSAYWGVAGDRPVAADFDGDGKTDVAIWRPVGTAGGAQWFIIRSGDGGVDVFDWGLANDLPLPGDFTGDGRADPAVYRESTGTWFVLDSRSRQIFMAQQWGLPGDKPRVADFDLDGRADITVWRPSSGLWFSRFSGGGVSTQQWGLPGDVPVVGSFASSGRNELAVYRPRDRKLYVLTASGPQAVSQGTFGGTAAVPVVGVAPY